MNKGDRDRQKKLNWNDRQGFFSDDSDNENVIFQRDQTFYIQELQQKHGYNIYLQQRPFENFEFLIMQHLGGQEIFEQIFEKKPE